MKSKKELSVVVSLKMELFVIIVNGWKPLSQSAPSWMLQQF